MNKNYQKGVRLERKLVNQARNKELIAFRSAGSHSPIDVVILSPKTKRVWFIQAKAKKLTGGALKREFEAFLNNTDEYLVEFKIVHKENVKEVLKQIDGI